jgi:hypothetical protein
VLLLNVGNKVTEEKQKEERKLKEQEPVPPRKQHGITT